MYVVPHDTEESVTETSLPSPSPSPETEASPPRSDNGEQSEESEQTTGTSLEEESTYTYGRALSTVSEKSEGDSDLKAHIEMLKNLVKNTMMERDLARESLTYTVSIYHEQQHLVEELDRMNRISHTMVLQTMKAKQKAEGNIPSLANRPPDHWIGGTWLAGTSKALLSAEDSWQKGRAQEALFKVVELMHTRGVGPETLVNARLLRAAIVRSSGQVNKSLGFFEAALQLAHDWGLVELAGKAQFHRGLCFLYLDRYAESSWCFLLSVHTPGHSNQIEVNRLCAEQRRLELPLRDRRRYLPQGFSDSTINLPKGEEFLDLSNFDHTTA